MFLDVIVVLAMTIPMLLFSVFPGIKLADYLEEKHAISETSKRKVAIITTIIFTITLSLFVHLA